MNKPTKKRFKYNEDILYLLKKRYGYPFDYIRKALRGDRTGTMPDILKKEYIELEEEDKKIKSEAKRTLENKAEDLTKKIND